MIVILHAVPAQRGKGHPTDKVQVEAAKFLPRVGLARSKQDLINRGHSTRYLYRFQPAGVYPRYLL
jgi:hypothetical protein